MFPAIARITAGPVKPKLVAKAGGNEASPWKLKRDAPKLSAKDVPATLRPLMSCALWRLHESIDRNDSNELFLLSDESEIRATAQKLNITVRSTHELRVLVAAKAKRPDLSSFGDLEREFGIHTRADKERSPSNRSKGAGMHLKTEDDDLTKRVERMETSILSEKAAKINNSHTVDERNGTKLDQIVKGLSSEGRETAKNDEKRNSTEEPLRESTLSLVEDKTPGKITPRIGSPNSAYHIALSLDGANDTATRSFLGIKGEKTLEATPGASCSSLSDKATKPVGSPPKDFATSTAAPPVSSATVPLPTPIVQPEHESEDSDEDVVVFVPQPKRSSLQKKPTQQSSRPSTPVTQPQQQKPVTQSPKLSPPTTQDQAKLPGRGKTPLVISHSHSKPIATTMIIDPDSFGRSYAVNPNSSPRTLQNPRSHHRPQSSIENALFPHGPRGPTRQSSFRISPSRQSRTNSARTSPAPQPQYETVRPRSSHAERTSSQKRSQALETKATGLAGRGSNHANSGTQLPVQRKTLNVRMVESEEFVPRIASTEARLDPIGTPQVIGVTKKVQDLVTKIADPKIQVKPKAPEPPSDHPDDLVSRSPTDAPQVERETPKPSAFESNEFVPRKVMPASQYNRRMPEADTIEPRASMPDVQYVLKSGSTRAATRGRGRLWIPS